MQSRLTTRRVPVAAWAFYVLGAAVVAGAIAMGVGTDQAVLATAVGAGGVALVLVGIAATSFAPRSSSLAFMTAGAFWMVVGTLYGLTTAIHLVAPEFFNNISWLVFGRTRPSHINTVIFGFIVSTLLGAALHYIPSLLKTPLWSEKLAWASFVFWQLAVISGPSTFSFGVTQGREYTEYVWQFDVCVMLAFVLVIFNMAMTISRRQEKLLYVSVWYFMGMLLWTAGVYPIGNVMWRPRTGAMEGLIDSVFLWFYGHNVVGLLLTPLAIAAAYYIMPRVAKTPLYSHTLSLVGFFSLVTFYTHIGGHHILQTPIPNWLKTISVVDSIGMLFPVFVVLANLWMTVRGRAGAMWGDPAGRFVLAGSLWYLVTCVQGPLQSLPDVQKVTHFGNWTIGHAHVAVLGFAGFIALGALWHVLPLVTGREIWSRKLVNLQFGLVLTGLGGFFVVLTIAGLIQGSSWLNGQSVYKVLPQIIPYMFLRAMLGIFIIASAVVGLVNVLLTIFRGPELAGSPAATETTAVGGITNAE
ncbi:MAG: cbb3-type cytochrome c oxidase subunit I [Phycisphaerae bacterium]